MGAAERRQENTHKKAPGPGGRGASKTISVNTGAQGRGRQACPCCGYLPPRWRMSDRLASLEIDRLRAEVEALRERVRELEGRNG